MAEEEEEEECDYSDDDWDDSPPSKSGQLWSLERREVDNSRNEMDRQDFLREIQAEASISGDSFVKSSPPFVKDIGEGSEANRLGKLKQARRAFSNSSAKSIQASSFAPASSRSSSEFVEASLPLPSPVIPPATTPLPEPTPIIAPIAAALPAKARKASSFAPSSSRSSSAFANASLPLPSPAISPSTPPLPEPTPMIAAPFLAKAKKMASGFASFSPVPETVRKPALEAFFVSESDDFVSDFPMDVEVGHDRPVSLSECHIVGGLHQLLDTMDQKEGTEWTVSRDRINVEILKAPASGSTSKIYENYLNAAQHRESNSGILPQLFFDTAEKLFSLGAKELSLRVLTSVADLELENPQFLRIVGFKISEFGPAFSSYATNIFRKALQLKPV
eukprot:TRINITY_DN1558_c0_g1_i3.p1 TRINITY_DN1558_c0_g1~~TRINITY_DN1558_c0_g1_i3.p1  ORF type:complete len:391 (+),score=51.27 TRINITY_DN1558_c0_g1_i3:2296-3468(+)